MVADAGARAGAEREVDRSGRDREASLHEAFGKKAMRFRKIACVAMEQLRAHPHGDIAGELEPAELERGSPPLDRGWGAGGCRRMLSFSVGEAVGPQESRRLRGTSRAEPSGLGRDSRSDVIARRCRARNSPGWRES